MHKTTGTTEKEERGPFGGIRNVEQQRGFEFTPPTSPEAAFNTARQKMEPFSSSMIKFEPINVNITIKDRDGNIFAELTEKLGSAFTDLRGMNNGTPG